MNPSAITTTHAVDVVFYYIVGICIVMLLGITVTMIYFVIRYHRSRHPRPEPTPSSSLWLETTWTVVPLLIVLSMFWYGWAGYTTLADVPKGAMTVQVVAQQWYWTFIYPNGKVSHKLYVPVGQAIKLQITSKDVVHSFYVPAFRIKKDAVPGMTTYEWFRAPVTGSYDAFCAQYCGVGHSAMITTVEAVPKEKFLAWYRGETAPAESAEVTKILTTYGCLGCHSLDGSKRVGPTLKGIFGSRVTVVTAGRERTVTADEAYIRRSIEEPLADIVKGFPPVMPSFKGKISPHELDEIVEFFRGTGGEQASVPEKSESAAAGKDLAARNGCTACHSVDGSKGVGPTWKGLFGSRVTVVTAGRERTIVADGAYLKKSITDPGADVVKGYSPVMPTFPALTPEQVDEIVAYIEELK